MKHPRPAMAMMMTEKDCQGESRRPPRLTPTPTSIRTIQFMSTNTPTYPLNPIAAVTHPDPYPYYADLVARMPLYYDAELRLWIASSADAVTAVLTSDLCLVRPPTEPIPKALLGSASAEIFR